MFCHCCEQELQYRLVGEVPRQGQAESQLKPWYLLVKEAVIGGQVVVPNMNKGEKYVNERAANVRTREGSSSQPKRDRQGRQERRDLERKGATRERSRSREHRSPSRHEKGTRQVDAEIKQKRGRQHRERDGAVTRGRSPDRREGHARTNKEGASVRELRQLSDRGSRGQRKAGQEEPRREEHGKLAAVKETGIGRRHTHQGKEPRDAAEESRGRNGALDLSQKPEGRGVRERRQSAHASPVRASDGWRERASGSKHSDKSRHSSRDPRSRQTSDKEGVRDERGKRDTSRERLKREQESGARLDSGRGGQEDKEEGKRLGKTCTRKREREERSHAEAVRKEGDEINSKQRGGGERRSETDSNGRSSGAGREAEGPVRRSVVEREKLPRRTRKTAEEGKKPGLNIGEGLWEEEQESDLVGLKESALVGGFTLGGVADPNTQLFEKHPSGDAERGQGRPFTRGNVIDFRGEDKNIQRAGGRKNRKRSESPSSSVEGRDTVGEPVCVPAREKGRPPVVKAGSLLEESISPGRPAATEPASVKALAGGPESVAVGTVERRAIDGQDALSLLEGYDNATGTLAEEPAQQQEVLGLGSAGTGEGAKEAASGVNVAHAGRKGLGSAEEGKEKESSQTGAAKLLGEEQNAGKLGTLPAENGGTAVDGEASEGGVDKKGALKPVEGRGEVVSGRFSISVENRAEDGIRGSFEVPEAPEHEDTLATNGASKMGRDEALPGVSMERVPEPGGENAVQGGSTGVQLSLENQGEVGADKAVIVGGGNEPGAAATAERAAAKMDGEGEGEDALGAQGVRASSAPAPEKTLDALVAGEGPESAVHADIISRQEGSEPQMAVENGEAEEEALMVSERAENIRRLLELVSKRETVMGLPAESGPLEKLVPGVGNKAGVGAPGEEEQKGAEGPAAGDAGDGDGSGEVAEQKGEINAPVDGGLEEDAEGSRGDKMSSEVRPQSRCFIQLSLLVGVAASCHCLSTVPDDVEGL
jgi:hypothetical protein